MFDIDDALADVVTHATQPALAAIKLAWWREQLEALDTGPPPAEPRLQAAATELLPRGITGVELARLETGWATLLDQRSDPVLVASRGASLFAIGARLLGATSSDLGRAGALYALIDVTRRGLSDLRGDADSGPLSRFPPKLRPLTGLASLARRDLQRGLNEPEATPGRSWTLMRHRVTGRV